MNTAFDFILIATAATPIAMLLVAAYKMARPSAGSASIVVAAFLSGQASGFLIALSQAVAFSKPSVAGVIIAGLLAFGTAAGIRATDNRADEKRTT